MDRWPVGSRRYDDDRGAAPDYRSAVLNCFEPHRPGHDHHDYRPFRFLRCRHVSGQPMAPRWGGARGGRGTACRDRRTGYPAFGPTIAVTHLVLGWAGDWRVFWPAGGHQWATCQRAGLGHPRRARILCGRDHCLICAGGGHALVAAHSGAERSTEEPVVDVDRWSPGRTLCRRRRVSGTHYRLGPDRGGDPAGLTGGVDGGGSFRAVVRTEKISPTTSSDRTDVDGLWRVHHERTRDLGLDLERFVNEFLHLCAGQQAFLNRQIGDLCPGFCCLERK